jgi:hypothetical protein
MLEENISTSEKPLLALAHSVELQRYLLEGLKTMDGHKWSAGPASALFGDAVLYKYKELQIVEKRA